MESLNNKNRMTGRNNWNPFVNNSESRLFCIGLVCFLLAALLSNFGNVMLLGSLKIANTNAKPWYVSLANLGLILGINTLLLYLFGLMRYAKTRFIDVLNAVLIAHIAMYLLLAISVIPFVADFLRSMEFLVLDHIDNPAAIPMSKIGFMIVFALVALACLILFFALLIMGMKIATNSKKGADTFIIILLVLVFNTIVQFINIYI